MSQDFFFMRHEVGGVVDKTPEVKVSQGGTKYYRINLVSKEPFQKKDGTTGTRMEFHNLVMFAGHFLYDKALKCKSGDVMLVGCNEIRCEAYQGKDDTYKVAKSIPNPQSISIIKMSEEEEIVEVSHDEIPSFE